MSTQFRYYINLFHVNVLDTCKLSSGAICLDYQSTQAGERADNICCECQEKALFNHWLEICLS